MLHLYFVFLTGCCCADNFRTDAIFAPYFMALRARFGEFMETKSLDAVLEQRLSPELVLLRLSNPGRLNSFTAHMWIALTETIERLGAKDSGVRCIIITGADRTAFAAGSDISEFRQSRANAQQARQYGEIVAAGIKALEMCEVPLVAMIQGACVGGGLAVASLCDIQVAGESARFGVPVNRLGLVMAHAEMQGLLRSAGPSVVREVLLEGRIFSAKEALAKGLVSRVVADDEVQLEVDRLVAAIVKGAPLVARWHKRFIRRLLDPAPLSEGEVGEAYACFDTKDYRIGLEAFEQKTNPQFVGA